MKIKNQNLRDFVDWVNANEPTKVDLEIERSKLSNVMNVSEPWQDEANNRKFWIGQRLYRWARSGQAWYLYKRLYGVISIVFCLLLITVMLMTVNRLPVYGDPSNPTNNEVGQRYIESGIEETGAINFVTGMILDYRAFDTLGESNVLFIAVISVLLLLRNDKKKGKSNIAEMDVPTREHIGDSILRGTTAVLFPIILIFGIYVILNGHLSAGGGFSGGALIGAGLILYRSAFGEKKAKKFFTYNTYKWISFAALMTYAGLKCYSFYSGANAYYSGAEHAGSIPLGTPGAILSSGFILPLNICVGLVVSCTMYAFYSFFRKGDI